MNERPTVGALLLTLLFFFSNLAEASFDNGAKVGADATAAMMASPPLPTLSPKAGKMKLSLKPAYVENKATSPSDEPDTFNKVTDYSGAGISVGFFHSLTDYFGYYAILAGSQVSGSLTSTRVGSTERIEGTNIKSSFGAFSAGLTVTPIQTSWFSMPIMFGPSFIKGSISQTVKRYMGTTLESDYDQIGDIAEPGYLMGMQLGFKISKYFAIAPYYIRGSLMDPSKKCQPVKTNSRIVGEINNMSSENCRGISINGQPTMELNLFMESYGVNFMIPEWGLGFTVHSEYSRDPRVNDTILTVHSVGWTLGGD